MEYTELLSSLRKSDLVKIVNMFHEYCLVYNYNIAKEIINEKKVDIINYLVDIKSIYIKYLIYSLDLEDYKLLKKDFNNLKEYLKEKYVIINDTLAIDVKDIINKLIKNKNTLKIINKNNELYLLSKGIITAYGVIDKEVFLEIIGEENYELINLYYKKNYQEIDNMIVSLELKNKKKINKYFKNKDFKVFPNRDYLKLGKNIYHHQNKEYKKLIKVLKNNYVFKNKDIKFLDDKVIIPYLYNNWEVEEESISNLNKNIDLYFEFASTKLKEKLINKISKLKIDFPMWEYRGKSLKEVENNVQD